MPCRLHPQLHFYPRPLRRGRRRRSIRRLQSSMISIHALFAEGDRGSLSACARPVTFLSTPSSQRATYGDKGYYINYSISIHALFAEGDSAAAGQPTAHCNFYPRPLRRGRLTRLSHSPSTYLFLSTPSSQRATRPTHHYLLSQHDFYPRPLRRGRRACGLRAAIY